MVNKEVLKLFHQFTSKLPNISECSESYAIHHLTTNDDGTCIYCWGFANEGILKLFNNAYGKGSVGYEFYEDFPGHNMWKVIIKEV